MQIVTLTSDFGLKDSYVSALKGALLRKTSNLNLIDISHLISPFDIIEGAYILKNSYSNFPAGTIHIVSINSYYNQNPNFVAFEKEGHFFLGPNNGLFSLIFDDLDISQIRQIDLDSEGTPRADDYYSHAVACLSNGLGVEEVGSPILDFERRISLRPVTNNSSIRATIIHVDHYGNAIINLSKSLFEKVRKGRDFEIYFKRTDPISSISNSYGDGQIGEVISLFNASDLLEIAINMGNASRMLNLNKDETIQIDFKDD